MSHVLCSLKANKELQEKLDTTVHSEDSASEGSPSGLQWSGQRGIEQDGEEEEEGASLAGLEEVAGGGEQDEVDGQDTQMPQERQAVVSPGSSFRLNLSEETGSGEQQDAEDFPPKKSLQ